MKNKIFILFIATLLIVTVVLPVIGTLNEKMYQINDTLLPPSAEWMKTFGGDEFDHFHSARQTSDGGYIACGITEESNEYFAWLVKVDSNGNEEWTKINHDINGTDVATTSVLIGAFDVIETSDKGFLICGVSMYLWKYEGEEFWVPTGYFWKTDDEGNTEWVKHYWEEDLQKEILGLYWLYNVLEVSNGFVCTALRVNYDVNGVEIDWNGSIIKTDLDGNKLWSNEFGNNKDLNSLSSICHTDDGGYMMGGYIQGEDYEGNYALWMVKTDEDGEFQWEQIYDGPGNFEYTNGKGFYQTSDGGYIMNGVSNSYGHGSTDIWVIKTDSNGNKVWDKAYGGPELDYCWSMCKADNNGFALGISLNHEFMSGNKTNILIIETDENGVTEWESNNLDREGIQATRSINPTNDDGYIVAAMTTCNFGDPDCDALLYKIKSFDNNQPSKPTITGNHKGKPDKEYTFTASSSDPDGQQIFYKWDWGDGNFSEWLKTPEETYSWATKDNFEIRVLVKDWYGYESEWSDPFQFSTPKSKVMSTPSFLQKLFQRFPFFEKILNQSL